MPPIFSSRRTAMPRISVAATRLLTRLCICLGGCLGTAQAATEAELADLRARLSVLEAGIGELKAALADPRLRRSAPTDQASNAAAPPATGVRRAAVPSTSVSTRVGEAAAASDTLSLSSRPMQLLLASAGLVLLVSVSRRFRGHMRPSHAITEAALSDMPERRSEPPRVTSTDTIHTTELKSVMTGALPTLAERPSAVAEAELFLSYGRTRQAEEILREAIQREPADMESTLCLLELLASARQLDAFNRLATQAWQITGAVGPVWKQIAALGNALDPSNGLYEVTRFATAPNVRIAFSAKGASAARDAPENSSQRAAHAGLADHRQTALIPVSA